MNGCNQRFLAIFVKLAEAPSGIIAFYRLLFTLCVLIPALLCRKKERKQLWQLSARQWRLAVVSGALLAIHWVMWFESLRYTSVASSTVLVSLQPLFSILWGGLLLHETVTKQGMAGVFLAIAGSVIIGWGDFQVSGAAFWGDVLSFASAGVSVGGGHQPAFSCGADSPERTGRAAIHGCVLFGKYGLPCCICAGYRSALYRIFPADMGMLCRSCPVCYGRRAVRV